MHRKPPGASSSSSYSLVPLDRNRKMKALRGEHRADSGFVFLLEKLGQNKVRAGLSHWISLFHSELSHTWRTSISNGKFIIFKLMYTLPPLFWFLVICFSNSFSAVVMPVTSPLLPASSPQLPSSINHCHSMMCGAGKAQTQFPISESRLEATGNTGVFPSSCEPNTQSFQSCWSKNNMRNLSPSLSSNSRALKATLRNWIASVEQWAPPAEGGVLGWASTGFHLTTQYRISHSKQQCLTQRRSPHFCRMAGDSAFFFLLWPFRFPFPEVHRLVSERCQMSTWVNPGSPCSTAQWLWTSYITWLTPHILAWKTGTIVELFSQDCCEN